MKRRKPRGLDVAQHENEPTVLETVRPIPDVEEDLRRYYEPPSSIRELNFDDLGPRTRNGSRFGHYSLRDTAVLLEPPIVLTDFLRDPSLLPKRPPSARPS